MILDLHMHTTVSDGTDLPEELYEKVKEAGIALFSVTDHDAVKGAVALTAHLQKEGPGMLPGVEFSCRDEEGEYHILGYGFEPDAEPVLELVRTGHRYRMEKTEARLRHLHSEYGFSFPEEEQRKLLDMDNPGKPHLGNLMVRLGYAPTKDEAIIRYINQIHVRSRYLRPEEAIGGILAGGGIPVLAHAPFGRGDQVIAESELDRRIRRLMEQGLEGLEGFYSGYTDAQRSEMLSFARRYGLYVTAGSDYHGKNKTVRLGQTGLDGNEGSWPEGLLRFLKSCADRVR